MKPHEKKNSDKTRAIKKDDKKPNQKKGEKTVNRKPKKSEKG
jgi:hypothetical protein